MNVSTTGPAARGTVELRVLNTRRVLTALRDRAVPARIAELAETTSLTRPTVTQIVSRLEERGWIQRFAPAEAAGRPATRYGLRPRALVVLGADAGAHRAVVELAVLDGDTLARRELLRPPPLGADMIAALDHMVVECLDEVGIDPAGVLAGTVATPGIVDRVSGEITLAPGLGSWNARDVSSVLGARIGGPVAVENDANLAARAMCAVPGVPSSFLGLQWGQRLGSGVVLEGRILRGSNGAAGELGSLLLTDPRTGEVSRLEEVGRASWRPAAGGMPDVTIEELLTLVSQGEERAVRALRQAIDPLLAAVAPMCLGLDLQAVMVSGAIARSGPALSSAMEAGLAERGAEGVSCVLSPFHEDTVLRGAVSEAIDTAWAAMLDAC
ncbi:ROK family transcriptional regulator [Pseudactinotalea sp.]|uniref:ROK family transcriptional regulator n=1 Tax=Pseudactinotalea sp. TaxID=1926260 RepID=UPI003B3A295B